MVGNNAGFEVFGGVLPKNSPYHEERCWLTVSFMLEMEKTFPP